MISTAPIHLRLLTLYSKVVDIHNQAFFEIIFSANQIVMISMKENFPTNKVSKL